MGIGDKQVKDDSGRTNVAVSSEGGEKQMDHRGV